MYKPILFLIVAAIAFTSCRSYRHVYSPAPAMNPFFTEKGNSHLAAFYSGGDGNTGNGKRDKNEGLDLQAAYAITSRLALTTSYFFRRERDLYPDDFYDTSTVNYKRQIGDFGIGYFLPLDSRRISVFNLYAGLGVGKFSIRDQGLNSSSTPYSRFHNARVMKGYLQPSFNFFAGDNFCIGFAGRFSFVRYNSISTDYDDGEQTYFHLDVLRRKTLGFFEPSMNIQFRFPGATWLRTEAALGFASNWNNNFPAARTLNASVGLAFDFGAFKK